MSSIFDKIDENGEPASHIEVRKVFELVNQYGEIDQQFYEDELDILAHELIDWQREKHGTDRYNKIYGKCTCEHGLFARKDYENCPIHKTPDGYLVRLENRLIKQLQNILEK